MDIQAPKAVSKLLLLLGYLCLQSTAVTAVYADEVADPVSDPVSDQVTDQVDQANWSGVLGVSDSPATTLEQLNLSQLASNLSAFASSDARLPLFTPEYEAPNENGLNTGVTHGPTVRRSGLDRYRVDQGTRLTGWQLGDGVYFGRSKGELSGVALIWQRSQTQQVSLSGAGLRLTRRLH